jgi:hypothetical protein
MKKITLASCLLILIALLVSARWGTKADDAPPADTLGSQDTTLAAALSLQEMINQSDVIAIGSCSNTQSVWVDGSLVTVATVSVSETLKGAGSETLTVVLPGGIDANRKIPVSMSYPGAPRLSPGENAFLFLTAEPEFGNNYTVAGFSQGKFSIVNDEDGEPMVSRDLSEMSLRGDNGVRRGQTNVLPLASFKEQVKGYLKNQ